MSEKDFEKELNGEELNHADENQEAVQDAEGSEWQFDAQVPTLDDSLELAGGYELDIPAEKTESFNKGIKSSEDVATIQVRKAPIKIVFGVILALAVIALLVFFGVRYYTVPNTEEKMNPGNIALTVGDTDVSIGMYDYFYESVVYEAEQYASYGYNNLDTSMDYSQQYTVDKDGNQITWLAKFKQDTIDRIKTVMVYYEKGEKAGITLTDEQKKLINQQIESLESNAGNSGMSVNEYIQQAYGEYCGVATLRSYLEKYLVAGTYFNQMSIEERPTDEEVQAYFNENQEKYMSCSYALIEMLYNTESDETKAQSLETVKKYAEQITDLESMKQALPEASKELIDQYISYGYFATADAAVEALSKSLEVTEAKSSIETNFGKEISDWLFSEDTAVGSTNYYISEDNGAAAVLLKTSEPKLDETEVYSVRHILIMPESASSDESTDAAAQQTEHTNEEWLAAKTKADEVLALYNSGEKTEQAFAKLAEEYSQDTESTSKGSSGIYGGACEGVPLGQMVPEFEGWAVDESRKAGDVGIVKSDYGYHIMYFISDGPIYNFNAKNDLMEANQQEEFDKTEVKEHSGMRKTSVAEPSAVNTQGTVN